MGAGGTVTIDGCLLSDRTWHIIQSAWAATGLPDRPLIAQGSWHQGALSGSTHNGGGAADVRIVNIPVAKREALVVHLRERNCCAWLRDVAHGWTTGDHIHMIVRDEPDLSSGAKSQVVDYDHGLNGLSNKGPDYHPRPAQHPIEWFDQMEDIVTPAEIQAVADAVWAKVLTRPWDGKNDSAGNILGSTQRYAIQGGFDGDDPKGSPTVAKRLLAEQPAASGALSDADVERIAARTADILAARLAQ